MSHLNVIGVATTLTLPSAENFNLAVFDLAINGQIRQIAKLKLSPNFPIIWNKIGRKSMCILIYPACMRLYLMNNTHTTIQE